ncbi:MAG: YrdB family protein [Anaerolineae bacterium]
MDNVTMQILKSVNLALAFLLELGMLAAYAYWGFNASSETVIRIVVGIGLPVLAATIWGIFLAPRSSRRLTRNPRVAAELAMYALAALALAAAAQPTLAVTFAVVVVINVTLLVIWKQ